MFSMNHWSQHILDAERAWRENRTQYLREIAVLKESVKTKNELRNVAEWAVNIAIRAETARALNHMRSSAIIHHGDEPSDDLSVFLTTEECEGNPLTVASTRASLLASVTTPQGTEMALNLLGTLEDRMQQLVHNTQWWQKQN